MSNLIKSASSYLSAQLVSSIVTVPGMILLARTAGSSVLGQYFLVVAALNLLTISLDFGIGSSIVRYEREHATGEFFTGGIVLRIIIIILVSPIILLSQDILKSYFGFNVGIYLIMIFAAEQVSGALKHALEAENKVATGNWINTIKTIIKITAQLGLVLINPAVNLLILGHLISTVIGGFIYTYTIDTALSLPTKKQLTKLFQFGVRDYFSGVETFGTEWIDSLILGYFLPPSAVGIYEIAWSISNKVYSGSKAVVSTLYPRLVEAETLIETDRIRKLRNQGLIFGTLLIFPGFVGFLVIGKGLLVLYGPEFVKGYSIVLVLICGRLFQSIDGVYKMSFKAASIPWARSKYAPFIILSNIVINVALIPELGLLGASIGTTLSFVIAAVIGLSSFGLFSMEVTKRWFRQILASVLMGSLVYFVSIRLPPDELFNLVLLLFIGVVSFVAILSNLDKDTTKAIVTSFE